MQQQATFVQRRCGTITHAKKKKKGKGGSAGAATADSDGESTVQKLAAEDDSQEEYEPIEDATERMEGALDNTASEFAGIRTGAVHHALALAGALVPCASHSRHEHHSARTPAALCMPVCYPLRLNT